MHIFLLVIFFSIISFDIISSENKISFNKDIRPVLSNNCFSCHGPDEASRKGDLRLDVRAEAIGNKEGSAIFPGKPELSSFIDRIKTSDLDDIMPPIKSNKKLTKEQILMFEKWIRQGAKWEDHWAYTPLKFDENKIKNYEGNFIDYYVNEKLKLMGLKFNNKASKNNLIRRVSFDIIGLPPTVEEVNQFLKDNNENAYEKLLDYYFSKNSYGEHKARYWLDAARYADTHGMHLDNVREIWPYRDWVINSFNKNQPFDQFTIEQIGGDLLQNPTDEQLIATGFNRCNPTSSEGGSIEKELEARYTADRVATTSAVWLGLTMECAQCHDHKFDPISMEDYYTFSAFFNNTVQTGMMETKPKIEVFSFENKNKIKELNEKIKALELKLSEKVKNNNKYGTLDDLISMFSNNDKKINPTFIDSKYNLGTLKPFTVFFKYKLPNKPREKVILARQISNKSNERGWRVFWTGDRIEVEIIDEYPNKFIRKGTVIKDHFFASKMQNYFAFTYDGSGRSEGIKIMFPAHKSSYKKNLSHGGASVLYDNLLFNDTPIQIGSENSQKDLNPLISNFFIINRFIDKKEFNIITSFASKFIDKKVKAIGAEKGQSSKDIKEKFSNIFFNNKDHNELFDEIYLLKSKLNSIKSKFSRHTLVMKEKDTIPMANILERGQYDAPGKEVNPSFPKFIPKFNENFEMNRLGLAKWLVHKDNPLTSRVIVNRMWQELFGRGLVSTPSDFGYQGDTPTHPELLDFLAKKFIELSWDRKKLYKYIMMSKTYKQSSYASPKSYKNDSHNKWLSRGPRFRLDAEVIRDQALFVSGLLTKRKGGFGVKIYQPEGMWKPLGYKGSNTQVFVQDFGPDIEGVRSIYAFLKRTSPPPVFAVFDAPNRENCILKREITNTPLQALALLNEPQYVRTHRHLALKVINHSNKFKDRINFMSNLLFSRDLTQKEEKIAKKYLNKYKKIYNKNSAFAKALMIDSINDYFSVKPPKNISNSEFASWILLSSQMMNSDEFINKN